VIGVLVPARNEAQHIARCIDSIVEASTHRDLHGESVCIIVAADSCTDATVAIAREAGAQVVEVAPPGGVGLARATAAKSAIAGGARWLATTDADSEVPADWLAVQLGSRSDVFCGLVQVLDWEDYETTVASCFSVLHPHAPGHAHVHGANLGISSQAYLRCGGFPCILTGEDRQLVANCQRLGMRIVRSSAATVSTSARRHARAPSGFSDYLKALEQRLLEEIRLPPGIAPSL
jgi:glycosyltransferase involved in cell wall biosynthesis